jgi:hypothetical protein
MSERPVRWQLSNFGDCLERWIELEQPPEYIRLIVTEWLLTRIDDAYVGVRRQPELGNLWFGTVPGTLDPTRHVVACSYWIDESTRTVRCDSIATLSFPV